MDISTSPGFSVQPNSKYADANIAIVEYEASRMVGVNFFAEVDLTRIEERRESLGSGPSGRRVPYTAFVVEAAARALTEFPHMNSRVFPHLWNPFRTRLVRFNTRTISVAAERAGEGLESTAFCEPVPESRIGDLRSLAAWLDALSQADSKSNEQWRQFSQVIERLPRWLAALVFRLPCWLPSLWVKYRGGSVLVSSPAKYGVDSLSATWVWPIGLSFGLAKDRPVARDGQVMVRRTFTLIMSFDRRHFAGAQAARFFRRIVEILENGEV